MKPEPLTEEEESLIKDDGDIILLEIIKGMSLKELRHFDIYKPDDMSHYCEIQCRWLHTEKHLLCHRNGKEREITEKELIDDICKCHNGERFRVFYVLKYPKRVTRDK